MARRERTRHLIELGGLVHKAGLVDLTDDDRATLYGAMLDLVAKARGEDAGDVLALWKRRGKRAFDAEAQLDTASCGHCLHHFDVGQIDAPEGFPVNFESAGLELFAKVHYTLFRADEKFVLKQKHLYAGGFVQHLHLFDD